MKNEYPKPNWWTLFALLPLFVVMLFGEAQLGMPPIGHHIAQMGIVIAFVGLLGLWQTANAGALIYDDVQDTRATYQLADHILSDRIDAEITQQQAAQTQAETQTETQTLAAGRSDAQSAPARLSLERYN